MALTPQQLALVTQYQNVAPKHDVNIAPVGQPPQVVEAFRIAPEQIMAHPKFDLGRKLELIDLAARAREEKNPARMFKFFGQIADMVEQQTHLYVGELASAGQNVPLEEQLETYIRKGMKLVDGHYGIRRRE